MNIYITADHHFSHGNIIKFCNRPFENSWEMDKFMINEWNSIIKDYDLVYYLGDFGLGSPKYLYENIISKLNGKIYFIKGNHDKSIDKIQNKYNSFEWIKDFYKLKIENKQPISLFHRPIESWDNKNYGSIHFHGHSHGKCRIIENRLDVGVDNIGYKPLKLEELLEIINKQNENL